jgi:uncharacterized membrane protein
MPRHPRWVRRFLSEQDLEAMREAIAREEQGTAGEIRVHLDHRCPGDPLARAVEVFERLGMHRTAARSGVLIYLAVADRKLAVIGDRGIHERLGQEYWEALVRAVAADLAAARPRDGLLRAVREVGVALRRHVPRGPRDTNELSDDVSLGGA